MLILIIETWNGLNFRFLSLPYSDTWVLWIFKIKHSLAPQLVLSDLTFAFWIPHQGKVLPSFSPISRKAYVELRVGKELKAYLFLYVAKSKTGSKGETSHKPWSRCACVWIFGWMVYELLSWTISLLYSFFFGHGLSLSFSPFFLNTWTFKCPTIFFSFEYLDLHVSNFFSYHAFLSMPLLFFK